MKRCVVLAAFSLCLATAVSGQEKPFEWLPRSAVDRCAAATIVVYNTRDPSSPALANFYAGLRGIPPDNIVGVDCSREEEISRDEYDATIADPLRRVFAGRGWWKLKEGNPVRVLQNKVRFVALMRGMPLKIRQAEHYPGDSSKGPPILASTNQASVDSELSVLGAYSRVISGALNNPYYRSFTSIFTADMPAVMLVCRLDGPSDAIVRRMIEDSVETEKTGLWGFAYINERGVNTGGYALGDRWMRRIEKNATRQGVPCIVQEGPALFARDYPMRNAALYYGWYSANSVGPFTLDSFQFTKGAVACHIHSYSAATIRDPKAGWVGPLLAHGAAASMGNVYEPYLPFLPHLDVFDERLRAGFTFAESGYMSQPVLSWMPTFVGDPLYRPFKLNQDVFGAAPKSDEEWAAYRDGVRDWFYKDRAAGEAALRQAGNRLRSGVIFEGLGLLEKDAGDLTASLAAFDAARRCYKDGDDILRVAIHEVRLLRAAGRDAEGLALVRKEAAQFPDAPALRVLRDDAARMTPP